MFSSSALRTHRPAVLIVNAGAAPSYFPGYWQPDGSWAEPDNGPGGETAEQRIAATITERGTVPITIMDFSGELTVRDYSADDLPENGGNIELPSAPVYGDRPRFACSIELGNAAMQGRRDVARALRELADNLPDSPGDGPIRDDNGGTVGSWYLETLSSADQD